MNKKVTLLEAKSVVCNPDSLRETATGFAYAWFGKYNPDITIILGKEWPLNEKGELVGPMAYYSVHDSEIPSAMNWDFNASRVYMYPVKGFRKSRAGNPVVEMAEDCVSATEWLICADWGGADTTFGRGDVLRDADYLKSIGILYGRSATSNGGGMGTDYYIAPKTWRASPFDPDEENFSGSYAEEDDARHVEWVNKKCAEFDIQDAVYIEKCERLWDALYDPDGRGARFVAEHDEEISRLKRRAAELAFGQRRVAELGKTCITVRLKDYPYTERNLRAVDYQISLYELAQDRMGVDRAIENNAAEIVAILSKRFPEYASQAEYVTEPVFEKA